MSVSRRQALVFGAALPPAALFAELAGAQTRPQSLPQHLPAAGATETTGQTKDPLVAACALIEARKQIEMCQYALKKLQTDDVKAFARAVIEQQEEVKRKLKDMGYGYPVAAVETGGTTGDIRLAGGAGGVPAADAHPAAWMVNVGTGPLPVEAACLVALGHEIAENCVRNFRKEMDQDTGVKADKAFVGFELCEHMAGLAAVQAFRRHTTDRMSPCLAECEKAIEKNIATLKGLMAKLDEKRD